MDYLTRASSFVWREGTVAEKARLQHVLSGGSVPPDVTAALLAGQRPDGGFTPFWTTDYSGIDATCYRLAQVDQAGMTPDGSEMAGAIQFLCTRQHSDGSWEEDAAAGAAPPWAKPGDVKAQIYLTANAGLWVGRARRRDVAERAVSFLARNVDDTGKLPSFLHANWLAAALFWSAGERGTATELLHYLSGRLAELSASSLAWLVTSLLAGGVSEGHEVVKAAGRLLLLKQRGDGAFPSEDGPTADVYSTLEAIRALRIVTSP